MKKAGWHNPPAPRAQRAAVHGPTGRVKIDFGTCEACGEAISFRRDMAVQPTIHVYCYGESKYRIQRHDAGKNDLLDQEAEW